MRVIKNCTKTFFTYCAWLIIFPVFIIPCCFLALFPQSVRYDNKLYFYLTSLLSKLVIKTAWIRTNIIGQYNIPQYPEPPAIIISNHASALDIAFMEMIVGSYPHIWMSKIEYKAVPIMGFLLQRMHVLVNRQGGRDAHKALLTMYNNLKDRHRLALLFPEGTRYNDGKIHHFHAGFGLLAQKLNRPVIPVIITGAHKIWPKKTLLIDSSASLVTIRIGKPMHIAAGQSVDDFVTQVQHYCEQEAHYQGV